MNKGQIAFEYSIPRMGHRIDVVCIIDGLIFLLEFKVGEREYRKSIEDQVMDYALDLKYFHELSRNRYIIPMIIPTDAPMLTNDLRVMDDKIVDVIDCNKDNIGENIECILQT